MILRLENTTTHQEYQYDVVDVNNGEKLYFRFNINTLDLDDGEYTIKVYDGDELILTDILKIGDFNANSLQYKKSDNTYIEVELTAKIQEKEVDITDIATLVKPDSGFDGMSSVFVDAQPLYDAAYTEGYDEGREDGEAVSFDVGFEAGVKMQKAKLESISITENGTYTKEDGYNNVVVNVPDLNGAYSDGYDDGIVDGKEIGYNQGYNEGLTEGIENAGEIIAEEAQVLDITENGSYLTKYSDDIVIYPDQVTGEFPDGTLFYDWGEIKNGCYNTEIPYTEGTVIELWWKQQDSISQGIILGNGAESHTDISLALQGNNLYLRKGPNAFTIPIDKSQWQHIKIETNGFVYLNSKKVDGIDLSTISFNYDNSPFLINAKPVSLRNYCNGLFGMVKVDDNIFIPKNGGFINYTTGEELPGYVAVSDGAFYKYTGNDTTNITGYFDDGTPFYNYAQLENGYFNTKIPATPNSRLEFWYKNNKFNQMYYTVIGAQIGSDFIFKIAEKNPSEMGTEYGKAYGTNYSMSFAFPYDNNWHHFIMSKSEGLVLDGVKRYDLTDSFQGNYSPVFYINCAFMDEVDRNANGYFGMVKIDNHTFIPTEDGFINLATNEILPNNFPNYEAPFDGEYTYTENPIEVIKGEGNLIKTLNVNIPPKLSNSEIKFGYSTFSILPDGLVDWTKVKDVSYMFKECTNLINLGDIDLSNATNMKYCFSNCSKLSDFKNIDISNVTTIMYAFDGTKIDYDTIAKLNTSKVEDMSYAFRNCSALKIFPSIDTSNVTRFDNIFENSMELEEVMSIDTSKATNLSYMFYNFSSEHKLRKLPEFDCTNVTSMGNMFSYYQDRMDYFTDCGGWKNLKCNWNDNYGLRACANLTYESCINILNGLWDFRGNGDTNTTRTLKVHQNFLDLVGDEVSIAVAKGWVIQS